MVHAIDSRGCAWIDGDYVPMDEAAIPINDTGFTRSDATYDVVAVWNGQFFRLDDHLERFERSGNKLRMRPPLSHAEMQEVVCSRVGKSGSREAHVEMIVTRGVPVNGDSDPFTAVLLDAAGNIIEGPGFNVFAYYDGDLITPSSDVLRGITRATVIDLAEDHGIACAVPDLSADRLRGADGIFLTSTAGRVMPVTTIDGKVLSNGIPGSVTTLVPEL